MNDTIDYCIECLSELDQDGICDTCHPQDDPQCRWCGRFHDQRSSCWEVSLLH